MNKKLFLLAVALFVAGSSFHVRAALKPQQPSKEVVTRFLIQKYPFRVPVEITDITIRGQHIEPGVPIKMNVDALQHLRVTVKNMHDAPLIGVGASVRFPNNEDGQPVLPELELMAGNYAHFTDKRLDYDFSIAPGATFELSVSPSFYDAHKEQVEITRQARFSNLLVQTTYATVDINREWLDGRWQSRDPLNSKRWLPDKRIVQKLISEARPRMERVSFRVLTPGGAFLPTECQIEKSLEILNCTGAACDEYEQGCYQTESSLADPPPEEAGTRWDNILRICIKYGTNPPQNCNSSCKKKTKKLRFLDDCP